MQNTPNTHRYPWKTSTPGTRVRRDAQLMVTRHAVLRRGVGCRTVVSVRNLHDERIPRRTCRFWFRYGARGRRVVKLHNISHAIPTEAPLFHKKQMRWQGHPRRSDFIGTSATGFPSVCQRITFWLRNLDLTNATGNSCPCQCQNSSVSEHSLAVSNCSSVPQIINRFPHSCFPMSMTVPSQRSSSWFTRSSIGEWPKLLTASPMAFRNA